MFSDFRGRIHLETRLELIKKDLQNFLSHQHIQNSQSAHDTGFSISLSMEILWKIGFVLIGKIKNLQDFDEMTDDKGVTNAFLFTNLAILLNAYAISR